MSFTKLGLFGSAGSGKDLIADWFEKRSFVKIAFADPIKRFVKEAFGFNTQQLWGPSEERNKEVPVDDDWWFGVLAKWPVVFHQEILPHVLKPGTATIGFSKLSDLILQLNNTYKTEISPRIVLQLMGTEWGRAVDPHVWIDYAYKCVDQIRTGSPYSQVHGLGKGSTQQAAGVIIPDHRFHNEVVDTQQRGGRVIKLRRLSQEQTNKEVGLAGHASEQAQKTIPNDWFDLVLELPEGVEKVHGILEEVYKGQLWIPDPSSSSHSFPPPPTTSTSPAEAGSGS